MHAVGNMCVIEIVALPVRSQTVDEQNRSRAQMRKETKERERGTYRLFHSCVEHRDVHGKGADVCC